MERSNMDKEHRADFGQMSDDELNEVVGGTRTRYDNVPNRDVAERMANLKCSRCGCRIESSIKSNYRIIGGMYVCKNCSR